MLLNIPQLYIAMPFIGAKSAFYNELVRRKLDKGGSLWC